MKLIILFLFFTSCANYVKNVHKQIDRDEAIARGVSPQRQAPLNQQPMYAYPQQNQPIYNQRSRKFDKRPIQNPLTLQNVQTGSIQSTQNSIYNQNSQDSYRYTAEDLKDNDADGSLWASNGGSTHLFTTSENIKRGDFVVIEVLSQLKDDIQEELKRAYPDPISKKSASDVKKEENSSQEPPITAKAATDDTTVYDKISTQVVDEVNQNYLIIRGRKEVVFKGAKRFIEIQAVVPRKDIKDTDTVRSDKILQPRITTLRF